MGLLCGGEGRVGVTVTVGTDVGVLGTDLRLRSVVVLPMTDLLVLVPVLLPVLMPVAGKGVIGASNVRLRLESDGQDLKRTQVIDDGGAGGMLGRNVIAQHR